LAWPKGSELEIKFLPDHFWNMIFERVKIGGKLHREEKDGVELGQVGPAGPKGDCVGILQKNGATGEMEMRKLVDWQRIEIWGRKIGLQLLKFDSKGILKFQTKEI
jgi:hypothetical protein